MISDFVRILPVTALVAALVVVSLGCGGVDPSTEPGPEEVGRPDQLQDSAATPEDGPTLEPGEETLINFASIEQFPDVFFSVSSDLSPNGHAQVPLIDNNSLAQEAGAPPAVYWAATVPATYEISLPPSIVLERIEIRTTGGTTAFEECVVFIREGNGDWKRPEGLSLVKDFPGTDDDGDQTRFVFRFAPTPVSAVLFGFAKGCERIPDQVRVSDIDLFGRYAL